MPQAFVTAKTCLLFLLAVALVAGLPMGCVYSLKAQLRYLTQIQDNGQFADISEVYEFEVLPRSVAFNLEPEGLLPRGVVQTPQTEVKLFTPPDRTSFGAPEWERVLKPVPTDDPAIAKPLMRAYDPVAPPVFSL